MINIKMPEIPELKGVAFARDLGARVRRKRKLQMALRNGAPSDFALDWSEEQIDAFLEEVMK